MKNKIKTSLKQFITEQVRELSLIENIKQYLISEDGFDHNTWEEFIDNQDMGDCQLIVSIIVRQFGNRGVKEVFGEIEVDEPSIHYDEEYDEDVDDYIEVEKENFKFTHHWIEINGKIYEFSKGTLKDNITWDNLYDVSVDGDEWRYNGISN